MTTLDELFSEDNMKAYSKACLDLAEKFVHTRKTVFPFDTLVIPSRGAFPFFLGMAYSLKKLSPLGDDIAETYKDIAIQSTLEPLMPHDSGITSDLEKKSLRVLLIPFTADLNIPHIDPEERNEEYTEKTRDYWARVTASFFLEPELRMKNPYFRSFAEVILGGIEGRKATAEVYEKFPKIGRFAMIDTVISGRASNDILGAFDNIMTEQYNAGASGSMDIPPFAFLIVDEKGEKLCRHPPFRDYLARKVDQRCAKLLPIPRIVSEDENSSLLGVSATIYPTLMRDSKNIEYNGKEFFVGAGSWHINQRAPQFKYFQKFMSLVYSGIDLLAADYLMQDDKKAELQEAFLDARDYFVKTADKKDIKNLMEMDVAVDERLERLNAGAKRTYETKSHVVHVPFSQSTSKKYCSQLCTFDYVQCKQRDAPSKKCGPSNHRKH